MNYLTDILMVVILILLCVPILLAIRYTWRSALSVLLDSVIYPFWPPLLALLVYAVDRPALQAWGFPLALLWGLWTVAFLIEPVRKFRLDVWAETYYLRCLSGLKRSTSHVPPDTRRD